MNKKILFVSSIFALIVATGVGGYFWAQLDANKIEQGDEAAAKSLVKNFGHTLKNVSLLSPTAAQDIRKNYKDLIAPELLEKWKADPAKALGRLTSSPWPDRIEIDDIEKTNGHTYRVNGRIIEITSVGGIAAERGVEIIVGKFGDNWLIIGVSLGEYGVH
jgi:hypothetical protein